MKKILIFFLGLFLKKTLKYLDFSYNSLTSIPTEIVNLTNLTSLNFSSNQLTSIPSEIGLLLNLKNLFLDRNNLIDIPANIGNLNNLTGLSLFSNNLTAIPPEIGNIDSLQYLYLDSNNISNLPSEIGNLTNILKLGLRANQLTSLPDSIVNITPINNGLDLGYNQLDTNNLSPAVIIWADKYDPDWRETQHVAIIYNPNIIPNKLSLTIKNSSIKFYLPTSGNIKLLIYNIKGKLLSSLVDSYKKAGYYKLKWDSKRYGSGVYFLKLSTNGSTFLNKFTIIK